MKIGIINPTFEQSEIINLLERLEISYQPIRLPLTELLDISDAYDFKKLKTGSLRDLSSGIDFFISSQSDHGLYTALILNSELGRRSRVNLCRAAILGVFKSEQRKIKLNNSIVKHPPIIRYLTREDIQERRFPNVCPIDVIVKPNSSAGSQGVTKVQSYDNITDAVVRAGTFSLHGDVMVESYVIGEHFIIDIFGDRGIIGRKSKCTDGVLTHTIDFKSIKVLPGKGLERSILASAIFVISAFGFDKRFPATVELIYGEDKNIYLVEAANRGAGVKISSLIFSHLSGIDADAKLIEAWFKIYDLKIRHKIIPRHFSPLSLVRLTYLKDLPLMSEICDGSKTLFLQKIENDSTLVEQSGVFLNSAVMAEGFQ